MFVELVVCVYIFLVVLLIKKNEEICEYCGKDEKEVWIYFKVEKKYFVLDFEV